MKRFLKTLFHVPGAAALCLLFASCSGGPAANSSEVPETASPSEVVAAYGDAMLRGDCALAKKLDPGSSLGKYPCEDGAPFKGLKPETMREGGVVKLGTHGGVETVIVNAVRTDEVGGFMGIGTHDQENLWQVTLERKSAQQPWRIVSQGKSGS